MKKFPLFFVESNIYSGLIILISSIIAIYYVITPALLHSTLFLFLIIIAACGPILNLIYTLYIIRKKYIKPNSYLKKVMNFPVNNNYIINTSHHLFPVHQSFQSLLNDSHSQYKNLIKLYHEVACAIHDVSSPIAIMEMNLEILARDIPQENIMMIKSAVQNVRSIVNNLLLKYRENIYAEHQQNDREAIASPVLLYQLIHEVIEQKRYEWLGRNCQITLHASPSVKSIWINATSEGIKRMVSNLLNNSIEACNGQAIINIEMKKDNNILQLNITDNGCGMSIEKIPTYLNGESSKHSGRGLGLSAAKKYMRDIQGKLNLTSMPSSGSTIILEFPITSIINWNQDSEFKDTITN